MKRGGRLRAKRLREGVTGRPNVNRTLWEAMKRALWVRARGRCEACRSVSGPLDPHHVQKRSQGGDDSLWNLVLLCRPCHQRTDAPFQTGRLLVEVVDGPDGRAVPRFQIMFAKDKFHAQSTDRDAPASGTAHCEPRSGGRRREK